MTDELEQRLTDARACNGDSEANITFAEARGVRFAVQLESRLGDDVTAWPVVNAREAGHAFELHYGPNATIAEMVRRFESACRAVKRAE